MEKLEEKAKCFRRVFKKMKCSVNKYAALAFLGSALTLGYIPQASAETIRLINGKEIEGEIISQEDERIKVKTEYGQVFIDRSSIEEILYQESTSYPEVSPAPEVEAVPQKDEEDISGLGLKLGYSFPINNGAGVYQGINFNYPVNPNFSIEVGVENFRTSYQEKVYFILGLPTVTLRYTPKMGLPSNPYLGGGADFYVLVKKGEFAADSSAGFHFCAGTEVMLRNGKWSINPEIKLSSTAMRFKRENEQTNIINLVATLGIRF